MKFWTGVVLGLLVGVGGTALVFLGGHSEVAADCQDEPCPEPPCCNGDLNGDRRIDIADAVWLLTYIFNGRPEPVPIDFSLLSPEFFAAHRFVDNGDDTVTDNFTGVVWMKAPFDVNGDGKLTEDDRLTWDEARSFCATFEHGGHRDWRMPLGREVQAVFDWGPFESPLIAKPSGFWVGGPAAYYGGHWTGYLDSGRFHGMNVMLSLSFDDEELRNYVRAVRGGL